MAQGKRSQSPSCTQRSTSSNSRPERGPEPRGETKWTRRGSLWKVRQDVGETLAFPQQLSRKVHVETWAGGCQSLNLSISQEQEIGRRCAVVGFPPRTPFVTPVLPGPGSDTRMKMAWKVMSKMEKSSVLFPECRGYVEVGTSVACCGMGLEGVLPHCVCGSLWFLVLLFIFVWAGPSYRATYWRIAPLMKPWCAEKEVPTAANLNHYRRRDSCVRWHCDDEPLFGRVGTSKLIVSVSFWVSCVLQMEGQVLSGR